MTTKDFKDGDKVIYTMRYDYANENRAWHKKVEHSAVVVPFSENKNSKYRAATTIRIRLVNEKTGAVILKYVNPESLRKLNETA